jgi:hypothetical protein
MIMQKQLTSIKSCKNFIKKILKHNRCLCNMMKHIIFLFFTLTFFNACEEKSKLEILFERTEKSIGKKRSSAFQNIPSDSLAGLYFTAPDARAYYLPKDPAFFSEVKKGLEKGGIQEIGDFWCDCFFASLFHNYLNYVEQNRDTSLSKCFRAYEKSRNPDLILSLEHVLKNNYIALNNYNNHTIGDTIRVTLPVDPINGINYHVSHGQNSLDSVVLTGKLIQKRFKSINTTEYQYYPIEFDMKILKTSNPNINKFLGRIFQLNDIITIDLFEYSKIIN